MHPAAGDDDVEREGAAELEGALDDLDPVRAPAQAEEGAASEQRHRQHTGVGALAEGEAQPGRIAGERQVQRGAETEVLKVEHADADRRQRQVVADVEASRGEVHRGRVVEAVGRQDLLQLVHEGQRPAEHQRVRRVRRHGADLRLAAALQRAGQLLEGHGIGRRGARTAEREGRAWKP